MRTSPTDDVRAGDTDDVPLAVRWLGSAEEVRAVRPADLFVRHTTPTTSPIEGLAVGDAVGWIRNSRRTDRRWLNAAGPARQVAALVRTARAADADIAGGSIPRASRDFLSVGDDLDRPNEWDWFVTADAPPLQPYEDRVAWAGDDVTSALVELLEVHSPRFSARPGDADVLRWCVLVDDDATLMAAAAHVEHVPGVAHLASIVTRTDARGRGLGAAVTAWVTRALLAEGHPVVTLGMYADNDDARRLYHRLGYRDTDHFSSGYFVDAERTRSA